MESEIAVPFDWCERDKDNLQILCWALDRYSRAHLFRIENFKPFFFIELPPVVGGKRLNWDSTLANCLFLQLRRILKEDGPLKGIFRPSRDLYFYQGNNLKPYMLLSFRNIAAMKHCIALFNMKNKKIEFEINGNRIGELHVTVCENDVTSIRKMLTIQNCTFSGWLKFKGYHPKMPNTNIDNADELDSDLTVDAMGNAVYKDVSDEFEHISTLPYEREWIVEYEDISMATAEETNGWNFPMPLILSFDLEAYTDNHRIFPDMWNDLHVTFMNSCVIRRAGDKESTKMFGIVWGNVDEIPEDRLKDVTIIRVNNQLDINREMAKLVQQYDIDVITGYNILDFDFPFLDAKQQLEMAEWPQYGRLLDEKTELKSFDWQSGGYGFNSINNLRTPGRISIDMYPVIKRDHKLIKYNLNTVGKHFLGRTKHDVEPVEMFVTFERSRESSDEFNSSISECFIHNDNYRHFTREVKSRLVSANKAIELYVKSLDGSPPSGNDDINNPRKGGMINRYGNINWSSDELYEALIDIGTQEIEQYPPLGEYHSTWDNLSPRIMATYQVGVYLMTRVLVYCLIDADIALDLFDKLNTWINLIQMSAVVGVSITDVFTRGQQIRCLSQLYDYAAKKGIILNRRPSPDVYFNGGFVFTDLVPDLYDGIICVDFNSLYPSIMKQYNICYTTLIAPEHFRYFDDKQHLVHTVSVPRPDRKSKDGIAYDFDPKNKHHDEDEDRTGEVISSVRNALCNVVSDGENYYFRWIKKQVIPKGTRLPNGKIAESDIISNEGIVPAIVRYLVDERKRVRGNQKKYAEGTIEWNTEEAKQLALKCSANSMFGFMGAGKSGKRSLIEGAMCITSIGRQLIKHVNKYCEQKYGAHIVYGDTDSSMIDMHITDKKDYVRIGVALANELSGLFGEELKLEMEKVMKVVFTCPKKYIYYKYTDQGEIKLEKETGKPEITYKGVILARRDYPGEARTTYENLVRLALDGGTLTQAMKYLIGAVKKLLAGNVNHEELIIVKSMGASYKDPNYPMRLFGEYMARMGKPVKPGERIGYLVFKARNEDEARYMGHRMTTPELYEASKFSDNPMEIDYFYYLEKQYKTNIDMLMKAAFRKEFGKYSIMKVRRTRRCNWVPFNEPINFIVQLLLAKNMDINCLDLITMSMEAIDDGRLNDVILTENYETSS